MKKPILKRISDIEVARALIAHEAVECIVGKEQKSSAQPKKFVSCTGGAFWGKAGEEWPHSRKGIPLIPWLQIASAELNRSYGVFGRTQAVSFFINREFRDFGASSEIDAADLVVREYGKDDKLVPLARPSELERYVFHRVDWTQLMDYPSLSKYHDLFDESVYDALCEEKPFEFDNRSGIKIGGWPTPIQQDQQYPGECDLQIDMTENYTYCDSGIAYLSKNGDRWYARFETC